MHTSTKASYQCWDTDTDWYGSVSIRIQIHDPDRHQNLIICSSTHCQPSLKISCKSIWSFCESELIEMTFGLWTRAGPSEACIRWGPETDRHAVWVVDSGGPKKTCCMWAHWHNLANTTEPTCIAAMRPYVKLLWPLVIIRLHRITTLGRLLLQTE